ncbi:TPA_asm: hypothetical protein GIN61_08485 [Listeria monocytogenes]|nr:hypothetical protein [Listeria monocytogenes]EKG5451805.1 hypothetical protein [Listeria monocytogenes]HAA6170895.1 hypothetical protein [Listeria monocytogenes]HAA9026168.1 hypothetical protein [Listeria monocytogenes]HAB0475033.1 hypothetical protein [Listeria monocytogenes]
MMKQYYVLLDSDGYITTWSMEEQEGFIKIKAKEEDFNKLDFVRVEKGKAKVDESRRKKLAEEYETGTKSELGELIQENANLLLYTAEVELSAQQSRQDYADLLLTLAEAGVL